MKPMSNDATDTEKLRAAKAAIAGVLPFLRMLPHAPTGVIKMCEDIGNDEWGEFLMFEPKDQPMVDELKTKIEGLIKVLEA